MDFWDKVRYHRISNKVSQIEVAKLLGWSQANYSRAEKTKPNVTQEDIKKIALAIHVSEMELLGLDEILASLYTAEEKDFLCKEETRAAIKQMFLSGEIPSLLSLESSTHPKEVIEWLKNPESKTYVLKAFVDYLQNKS